MFDYWLPALESSFSLKFISTLFFNKLLFSASLQFCPIKQSTHINLRGVVFLHSFLCFNCPEANQSSFSVSYICSSWVLPETLWCIHVSHKIKDYRQSWHVRTTWSCQIIVITKSRRSASCTQLGKDKVPSTCRSVVQTSKFLLCLS